MLDLLGNNTNRKVLYLRWSVANRKMSMAETILLNLLLGLIYFSFSPSVLPSCSIQPFDILEGPHSLRLGSGKLPPEMKCMH